MPVKGLDEEASVNLSRLYEQTYSGAYEIIFALENETNSAVTFIQELIKNNPNQLIKLIFNDPLDLVAVGKIKNLIASYCESKGKVIVFIDSDFRVSQDSSNQSIGFLRFLMDV